MPSPKNACPQTAQMELLFAGELTPDEVRSFEGHLEQCSICDETIRDLAGANDTWGQRIEQVLSSAPAEPVEEDSAQRLLDRVQEQAKHRFRLDQRQVAESLAAEVEQALGADETGGMIRLQHYELLDLLGAGATGVVYSAIDNRLKRSVAIKILRPSLGTAARERFLKEARAAAAIDHPNVVTIFDVNTDGPLAFIVMPLLPGETLEDRLQRQPFLDEAGAKDIARQVCEGLAAAHQENIVHRDIKPANLWIEEHNEQVRILDFGLARIVDGNQHLTSTGLLAGTPNYMSPEQAKGLELDGRSDLFSLGCVLYRTMTGRTPFESTGVMATLQSIQHDTPVEPAELNSACSGEFSRLIMRLMEKNPGNRPDSANDVIRLLDDPDAMVPLPTRKNTKPKKVNAETSPGRSFTSGANRILIAICFVLIVVLAGLVGPDVYRIVTDQGVLVIDSDDPNVKVEILDGGKTIAILDTRNHGRIQIESGEYSLKPGGGNSRFVVTPNRVVLKRGQQKIITVTREAPDQADSSSPQNASANTESPESTYEGRTFSHWKRILKTETSPATICQAIRALGALSEKRPDHLKIAMPIITDLIREHGSNSSENQFFGSDLHESLMKFFSHLSPDMMVDFTLSEMERGTPNSIRFCVWLNVFGSVYEGDTERNRAHFNVLKARSAEVLKAWFGELRKCRPEDEQRINALLTLGASVKFWLLTEYEDTLMRGPVPPKIDPQSLRRKCSDQIGILRSQFRQSDHVLSASIAGWALAKFGLISPEEIKLLQNMLFQPAVKPNVQCIAWGGLLWSLSHKDRNVVALAANALREFLVTQGEFPGIDYFSRLDDFVPWPMSVFSPPSWTIAKATRKFQFYLAQVSGLVSQRPELSLSGEDRNAFFTEFHLLGNIDVDERQLSTLVFLYSLIFWEVQLTDLKEPTRSWIQELAKQKSAEESKARRAIGLMAALLVALDKASQR